MSIYNTDIQGNASVSRNVNAGGHADVKGDLAVGHNLTVRGWVDAPNIKGPLKGLYASEETLKAAYPRPQAGWYALVGDTLPADVWRAERDGRGRWVWAPTGEQGGEINLWLDQLEGDVRKLTDDVRDLEELLDNGLILERTIEFGATGEAAWLSYRVMARDGSTRDERRQIPIASTEQAGMMTAADKRELSAATDGLRETSTALTELNRKLRELEERLKELSAGSTPTPPQRPTGCCCCGGGGNWGGTGSGERFELRIKGGPLVVNPRRFRQTVRLEATKGTLDVTDLLADGDIEWSRESENRKGETRSERDSIWNRRRGGAGKTLTLTQEDLDLNADGEGLESCTFTATATLREAGAAPRTLTARLGFG